jgi:molybdate transport system ATP-binding protein
MLTNPIKLTNLTVEFDQGFVCNNINWIVEPGQHWLICGNNGSGKSALAAILSGNGAILNGETSNFPDRVGIVSFEAQAELIEAERRKDDADILDVIAEGTPVSEIIDEVSCNQPLVDRKSVV